MNPKRILGLAIAASAALASPAAFAATETPERVRGTVVSATAIGQILGTALPESEAVNVISRVIDAYLARRLPNERFRDTYRRLGATFFKEAAYAAA
jgi:hypothetical protein